jgi:hypothetical protein
VDDQVIIPDELLSAQQDMKLYFDVMHVDNVSMLTAINFPVRHRFLIVLKKLSDSHLLEAIENFFKFHKKYGHKIKNVYYDNAFRGIQD